MNFRDVLGWFAVLMVIPFIWLSQGYGIIELPGEVIGATIAVWALVFQFYFRKKGS